MTKKWRVAFADGSHPHTGKHLRELAGNPRVETVGLWDPLPSRAERLRGNVGLSQGQVYTDLGQLIEGAQPEVVISCASNARHAEIVELFAPHGIHVMVEKPFAATLEQANRMVYAASRGGSQLMCNWPTAWSPAIHQAREWVQAGRIGKLLQVRHRAGHNGPGKDFSTWFYRKEEGGGALLDFCSYGAHITGWVLGQLPEAVSAMAATLAKPVPVEDNAVVLARYSGVLGVWEATWTRVGDEPGPTVVFYGSEGVLTPGPDGLRVSRERGQVETVPLAPLVGPDNAIDYFLDCLEANRRVEGLCSPELGLMTQHVLEAATRAVASGTMQTLPLADAGR